MVGLEGCVYCLFWFCHCSILWWAGQRWSELVGGSSLGISPLLYSSKKSTATLNRFESVTHPWNTPDMVANGSKRPCKTVAMVDKSSLPRKQSVFPFALAFLQLSTRSWVASYIHGCFQLWCGPSIAEAMVVKWVTKGVAIFLNSHWSYHVFYFQESEAPRFSLVLQERSLNYIGETYFHTNQGVECLTSPLDLCSCVRAVLWPIEAPFGLDTGGLPCLPSAQHMF